MCSFVTRLFHLVQCFHGLSMKWHKSVLFSFYCQIIFSYADFLFFNPSINRCIIQGSVRTTELNRRYLLKYLLPWIGLCDYKDWWGKSKVYKEGHEKRWTTIFRHRWSCCSPKQSFFIREVSTLLLTTFT